jgi:hypothetical protein
MYILGLRTWPLSVQAFYRKIIPSLIAGLISQSVQLKAWLTFATLVRYNKSAVCAKSCARRSVCFCGQSGGGASIVCLRSGCNHVTEVGGP